MPESDAASVAVARLAPSPLLFFTHCAVEMTHAAGGGSTTGYRYHPFIRTDIKITFKFGTRADPLTMKPSLPHSSEFGFPGSPPSWRGERRTVLKNSPPSSLPRLSYCPLSPSRFASCTFARSISAHQPFWRQMPELLSLAPDEIFFNSPFFMRMQNGGEHQTARTDSPLSTPSSLSLQNPLRRLSIKRTHRV